MIGTFANAGTIILGSLIGGFFRSRMSEKLNEKLLDAMGLCALGLGMGYVIRSMPDSQYPVLFIISLALGCLIGTGLKLDERVSRLMEKHAGKKKGHSDTSSEGTSAEAGAGGETAPEGASAGAGTGAAPEGASASAGAAAGASPEGETLKTPGRGDLGQGIITASLIFCIGTLSILGPVNAALMNDHTLLFTNASLDLVTSMVLASAYGVGIALAAGILVLWQGSIYGITLLAGNIFSDSMMTELSIVGGFLIAMTGLSIMKIKDFRTLDYLPALAVPIVWCLIAG